MGKLEKWAKEQQKYIKLQDGETLELKYLGYKFVQSSFDSEKEIIRYMFVIDGFEKPFDSGSTILAQDFDQIAINSMVTLSRKGKGNKTKYTVELLTDRPKPQTNQPF